MRRTHSNEEITVVVKSLQWCHHRWRPVLDNLDYKRTYSIDCFGKINLPILCRSVWHRYIVWYMIYNEAVLSRRALERLCFTETGGNFGVMESLNDISKAVMMVKGDNDSVKRLLYRSAKQARKAGKLPKATAALQELQSKLARYVHQNFHINPWDNRVHNAYQHWNFFEQASSWINIFRCGSLLILRPMFSKSFGIFLLLQVKIWRAKEHFHLHCWNWRSQDSLVQLY